MVKHQMKWNWMVAFVLMFFMGLIMLSSTLEPVPSNPTSTIILPPDMIVEASYGVSSGYQEIIENSDLIVVAHIDPTEWTFNGARDTRDLRTPDPSMYALMRVYEVQVEQCLKGNCPKSFYFIVPDRFAVGNTPEQLQEAIATNAWEQMIESPRAGISYLVFLKPSVLSDGNVIEVDLPKGSYYSLAGNPALFDLSDPQRPRPIVEGQEGMFPPNFPPFSLDQIIAGIQNPDLLLPTATSLPVENPYPIP